MNRKAKSKSKLPIGAGQANQMTNKENHQVLTIFTWIKRKY